MKRRYLLAAGLLGSSLLAWADDDPARLAQAVRDHLAADDWKTALAEAREMSARFPDAPEARSVLGEALYRAGRLAEADTVLGPLEADPAAPARGLMTLGLVRAAQGREEQAAALLDGAVRAAPDDPLVLYRAAGAAASRAAAVSRLERYLALAPDDDPDRREAASGTIRLFKALGERRVWIEETRPERVELPLRALVGKEGRASGYVVDVVVGEGKRLALLLDTGSTGLFVLQRAVKKAGYVPLSEETVFAGGGEGRERSKRGVVPRIAFGELRYRDALVTITRQEIDPTGRYLGVLGLFAFEGYRATLDLSRRRLILEAKGDPPAGSPFWNVEGQLLVEARTEGGEAGLFVLDTGASRSLLSSAYAASLPGPTSSGAPARVKTYGGEVQGARALTGTHLLFEGIRGEGGAVTVADLLMRSRLSGVEISGFLGLDLLDGRIVVVDDASQRVRVLPPSRP